MGGVQPNPIDGKVYEGIQLCRREQVDMMLPVGGGSVIDTAKAIAAGASMMVTFGISLSVVPRWRKR